MDNHEINKLIAEREELDFRCELNGGINKVLLTQACAERLKTSFVFNPFGDWKQGGPLVEKYQIHTFTQGGQWKAKAAGSLLAYSGDSLLEAAMKAIICMPKDDEWPEQEEPDQCTGCGDQGVTIEGWPCDVCGDID